jgi:hypothetical protein
VPVARIGDIGLDVAVVEAAATVHVRATGHHVHAFRLAVDGHAGADAVPVARARCDVDAVDLVTARGDR